jgi:hypothetical protein
MRGLIAGGVGVSLIGLGTLAYAKSTNQKPADNTHADTEAIVGARLSPSQSDIVVPRHVFPRDEVAQPEDSFAPSPIVELKMPPPMIEAVPDDRDGPEQARTFDAYLAEMAESDQGRAARGAKPLSRVLIVGASRGGREGVKYPPSYFTMDVENTPDLTHNISKALDQKYHGQFDAVVFEHLPATALKEPFANFDEGEGFKYHKQQAFQNASNALKPGGRLIINEGFATVQSHDKDVPRDATLLAKNDTYRIYKTPRGVLWWNLQVVPGKEFQGKEVALSHHAADKVRHYEAQDAQARFEGTDFHFLGLKPVGEEPLWVKKPEKESPHERFSNPHVLVAIKK